MLFAFLLVNLSFKLLCYQSQHVRHQCSCAVSSNLAKSPPLSKMKYFYFIVHRR
jgi:hypothetical protein